MACFFEWAEAEGHNPLSQARRVWDPFRRDAGGADRDHAPAQSGRAGPRSPAPCR